MRVVRGRDGAAPLGLEGGPILLVDTKARIG